MNVLSLFDGMSCGQIALDRLGVKVDNYYSSEIDKYAMQVTMKNYPNTIQLGDVEALTGEFLHSLPTIDLLIGGSPCQGLSIAGKHMGLDDPRSILFYAYARIKDQLQPKYFILENVMMKQVDQDIISEILGVQPIKINSALVSAQNRKRLYWTNIEGIEQPEDQEIKLKDILEDESEGIIKSHGIFKDKNDKSQCIDANYFKGADNHGQRTLLRPIKIGTIGKDSQGSRIYSTEGKSVTLSANGGGWGAKTGLYKPNEFIRKLTPIECERLQTVDDNYTSGVSNTQRYKMLGNGWTIKVIEHILKEIK